VAPITSTPPRSPGDPIGAGEGPFDPGSPAHGGWAVVEIMGHRQLSGFAREVRVAGLDMLQVHVPGPKPEDKCRDEPIFAPNAIYAINPCTEQRAREAANPPPYEPYRPQLPEGEADDGDYEDDGDADQYDGEA